MLYSRHQLRLLAGLCAIFAAGLAVREWRAGFPDAAMRIERFDQPDPTATAQQSLREQRPSPSGSGRESTGAGTIGAEAGDRGATPIVSAPDLRPLDLNRATVSELARLPGVGAGLARRIVEERERRGRFDSPEALRQVVGLGPKKLNALRDHITVGE